MISQIELLLHDIYKNRKIVIFIVIQIMIANLFLFFIFTQYNQTINKQLVLGKLEKRNITYFNNSSMTNIHTLHNNTINYLEEVFEKKGCSYIKSLTLEKYPNNNVIIFLGDYTDALGINKIQSQGGTTVTLGKNVNNIDVGDTISLGKLSEKKLEVKSRLEESITFFDKGYMNNLDDTIIITITIDEFYKLYKGYYSMDIIQNIHVINYSNLELMDFISFMRTERAELRPIKMNMLLNIIEKKSKKNDLVFLTFCSTITLFVLINTISNVIKIILNNMKEYTIHLRYGATKSLICFRMILFTIIINSIPIIIIYTCLFRFYGSFYVRLEYLVLYLLTINIIVAASPLRLINRLEITQLTK